MMENDVRNKYSIISMNDFGDDFDRRRKVGYFIIHYEKRRWYSKWCDTNNRYKCDYVVSATVEFVYWLIRYKLRTGNHAVEKFMIKEEYKYDDGVYHAVVVDKDCYFFLRYHGGGNLFVNVYC